MRDATARQPLRSYSLNGARIATHDQRSAGGCVLAILICALYAFSAAAQVSSASAQDPGTPQRDGRHDFDFEFGSWKAHLKLLLHPLSGSDAWVDLDGTSVVRKVWDGRANLGELTVDNSTTHIEGLSLRLYNPQTRQWSIYWANSKDGSLGAPMVGQFKNGRGEFFNQDTFQGRAIYVRFIFSELAQNSFRLEQAFSQDGGRTWEPNWIATFTRSKE